MKAKGSKNTKIIAANPTSETINLACPSIKVTIEKRPPMQVRKNDAYFIP
jgi:hypothetical protein